ncbi:MAG: A/G-specific adenine glycosylase [Deltaproteobacteria bacterium]|nr:A/G-specific adenine glycosylase [Deltaproteobacteria bacterium]
MLSHDAHRASAALLDWYHANARTLPWRSAPTPWRVLLSELMLQQTRVDTVVPYYERFLARWPTVEAFADAPLDEVLEAWAGLGYYRRARNLHRAARAAVAVGGVPPTVEGLRSLPGVGDYTAGAVASIAFGAAVPAVDGNVERVISRLLGLELDPKGAAGRRAIYAGAAALLPAERPGDLNQALMELGATLCAPRAPRCGQCPIRDGCRARAAGVQELLPRRKAKTPPVRVRGVAAWIEGDAGLLLARRPEEGLLAGMWELPGGELLPGEAPEEGLLRLLSARIGLAGAVGARVGAVTHLFTHRRLELEVFVLLPATSPPRLVDYYSDLRWAAPPWEGLPLSTLARKTLALSRRGPLLAAEPGRSWSTG